MIRHTIYFFLYLYVSTYNYIYLYRGHYKTISYFWEDASDIRFFSFHTLFLFIYFSCGFLLGYVRITEPFVFNCFKNEINRLMKNKKAKRKNKKKGYDSLSLCQFTHSAMNVEFTYIILVGINKFMEDLPCEMMGHNQIFD